MDTPTDPAAHRDLPFTYLTTTGRVTGNSHTVEIWFALDPHDAARLYMLAGGGRKTDWVRNLARNPAVTLKLGDILYPATAAALAPDDATDATARRLLVEKYAKAHELDDWGRTALPVVFVLDVAGARPAERA